jgi:hypothetical protein
LAESYPPNTPIIICSHSIGSFISEKIVENNPELNIVKVIQLFPTLQHIKKSKNGQLMHWVRNQLYILNINANNSTRVYYLHTVDTLQKMQLG